MIEGATATESISRNEAVRLASRLRSEGGRSKESVAQILDETGVSRREAYRIWLESGEKT